MLRIIVVMSYVPTLWVESRVTAVEHGGRRETEKRPFLTATRICPRLVPSYLITVLIIAKIAAPWSS
jgi:hypothetical protein